MRKGLLTQSQIKEIIMDWTLIILFCWIVIGVFNYGMTFGHFQNTFPTLAPIFRQGDICLGLFMGIMGPISLLAFLVLKISGTDLKLKNIKFY